MAKKKLGYIELEWSCPSCGSRNAGTTKTCRTCGAAMPNDITFELPAEQKLDTSEETAKQVAAGPDIHCPFCGARNRGDAKVCVQCGGDLTEGERRQAGEVLGSFEEGPAPEVICPSCGTANPATRTHCSNCGSPLGKPEKPKPETQPPPKRKLKFKWILIGVLLALFACVLVMCQLGRGRKEALGTVQDVSWSYSIQIEALAPVTREAWHDEVPAEARVLSCSPKVRRTVDQPVPGAREVCGTPYVRDTGTGKGEVVQDCKYQILEDWCKYSVTEWRVVETQEATGHDFEPYWPTLRLASGQREGRRQESYSVRLLVDDRNYTYHPRDLGEYRRFQVGSEWSVTTNLLGGVTDVRPAE